MKRLSDDLQKEIEANRVRQSELETLILTLKETVEAKRSYILSEQAISKEMVSAQSKIKPGKTSTKINAVISEKKKFIIVERNLVDDLNDSIQAIKKLVTELTKKTQTIENIVERFNRPTAQVDIAAMRNALENASNDVVFYEKKIVSIRDRIDHALENKKLGLQNTTPSKPRNDDLKKSEKDTSPFGFLASLFSRK